MYGFRVEVHSILACLCTQLIGPAEIHRNVTEIHLDPVERMLMLKSGIHDEEISWPADHIARIKIRPEVWGEPAFREKVKNVSKARTEQGDQNAIRE